MGAIPQVPDREISPQGNILCTCDHCGFQAFTDESSFIEIHSLLLCNDCHKIYNFTCTACDVLFYQEKDLCRVDDITCKPCCNDACGDNCNHISEEVENDD